VLTALDRDVPRTARRRPSLEVRSGSDQATRLGPVSVRVGPIGCIWGGLPAVWRGA
jgi:hypothetical protein